MSGWRTIAKNEIRLWTTLFRKNRRLFFYSIIIITIFINISLILLNFFYIIPMYKSNLYEKLIVSFIIIPKLAISSAQTQQLQIIFLNTNVFSTLAIQLIPPFIEILCFFVFFMAITHPIQTSIRQLNVSHFEIVLSSPIEAKDMLLGNFLGRVPIYSIAASIFVPIFWSIISIFIPLSLMSYFTLTIILLWLFIIGTFLGTITASYVSLKLGQSEGGAEKAKGFFFLIGIILAIPILGFSMFPYAFFDPNIQFILKFIPTTWFGDIINFSIMPNFIPIELLFSFIGLASIFTLSIFYLGYHYGDRFYSLELGAKTETISITKEHRIYQFLRILFGPVFITQAKEFFRRRENLVRMLYGMILAMLIPISSIIFSRQNTDFIQILSGDVMSQEYPMILTGLMFAMMIGPMLGSMILVRSKDMVWIFKKSPRGVSALVNSFVQVNYFMLFLITFPVVIVVSLFSEYSLLYTLIFFINTNIWVFSALVISVGIQCWRPAFSERSPKMTTNILIFIGIFFGIFYFIIEILNILGIYSLIIIPCVLLILSISMLRFGIKKLNDLE